MAKWVRHFFRGMRADGTHFFMSGPAYKGLALVRVDKGVYSLTHMRTGARINNVEGEYADVRKYGEAIADLTDWEAIETPEAAVATPGLAERIKAVAEFYSFQESEEVAHA